MLVELPHRNDPSVKMAQVKTLPERRRGLKDRSRIYIVSRTDLPEVLVLRWALLIPFR